MLTTLGWYQKLAARAGAGTLVPITGFANAVVSPAIEFKAEGRVLGTGAKMFTIAGPVIVYGTLAAVVYGACCGCWIWGCSLSIIHGQGAKDCIRLPKPQYTTKADKISPRKRRNFVMTARRGDTLVPDAARDRCAGGGGRQKGGGGPAGCSL